MYRDFSGNYSVTGNLKSSYCNQLTSVILGDILLMSRILTLIFVF